MDTLKQLGIGTWSLACSLLEHREWKAHCEKGPAPANPFRDSLRIAFVKQSTYSDLYSDPAARTPRALLESSWHRPGPIGLFTEFDAMFLIVRPETDPECRVWEEKRALADRNPVRAADDARRHSAQAAVAVAADAVDWSSFDLVIAMENAVPARISKRHPSVLWATMLEHHRMEPYRAYLRRPPTGYDLFLNLRYGPNPQSLGRLPHLIDWPYNFTAPGVLDRVFDRPARRVDAPTLLKGLIEDHQPSVVAEVVRAAGFDVVVGRRPTLKEYLSALLESDVLVFPNPTRPLGGLAMLDAASAGVLLVGNRRALWNPFLVVPELQASSADAVTRILRQIAKDPAFRAKALARQEARLAWFGFVRPLRQIADFVRSCPRALSAAGRLVD